MERMYVTYHPSTGMWTTMFAVTYEVLGKEIHFPAHYQTDLGSSPRFLWALVSPFDLGIKSVIMHDRLYELQAFSRHVCDKVFARDMVSEDVASWRVFAAYWAVRLFGWKFYYFGRGWSS